MSDDCVDAVIRTTLNANVNAIQRREAELSGVCEMSDLDRLFELHKLTCEQYSNESDKEYQQLKEKIEKAIEFFNEYYYTTISLENQRRLIDNERTEQDKQNEKLRQVFERHLQTSKEMIVTAVKLKEDSEIKYWEQINIELQTIKDESILGDKKE